jgi:hypothetical protein
MGRTIEDAGDIGLIHDRIQIEGKRHPKLDRIVSRQFLRSVRYVPGTALTDRFRPLILTKKPRVAQPGTQILMSNRPPPLRTSWVVSALGKSVRCLKVADKMGEERGAGHIIIEK